MKTTFPLLKHILSNVIQFNLYIVEQIDKFYRLYVEDNLVIFLDFLQSEKQIRNLLIDCNFKTKVN